MSNEEKKAKELIEKFYDKIPEAGCMRAMPDGEAEWIFDEIAHKAAAKQCALIYCDGIISELEELHKPEYTTFIQLKENQTNETCDGYEKINFWQAVKTSIQNHE